ncbi:uncharacterized protein BT62DRAFT_1004354 [Guyanagaster necrorhizus]|uniref:Uncharacterized protein n=1 Tax=Guyanagaster necrorhizus TaxID=856835 RepID=A0A9P7VUH4_9AGAR|nr:uncharacterized protein BT62DRAFT_1004354 [Guyanagaster necrorhizus MCA 3950]KAG7447598.1 hypothetical protein BT62DRAFT_1004354 [Guyanagaster necrorhizus MCA 3950]
MSLFSFIHCTRLPEEELLDEDCKEAKQTWRNNIIYSIDVEKIYSAHCHLTIVTVIERDRADETVSLFRLTFPDSREPSSTSILRGFDDRGSRPLSPIIALFHAFPQEIAVQLGSHSRPDQNYIRGLLLYLGINDCSRTPSDKLEPIVEALSVAVHDLWVKAGTRNFVLVDVPLVDRSPSALDSSDEVQGASGHGATFSVRVHPMLTDVLGDQLEYDFAEDDPTDEGGSIWEDDLH